MCLNNLCIPAEIVTHRGKDVVELSCSFEGTWILSCSSDVTGGRSHPKTLNPLISVFAFRLLFWPVPLLQMWFLFFFSFSVIISEKHLFFFFLSGCMSIPLNTIITFRLIYEHLCNRLCFLESCGVDRSIKRKVERPFLMCTARPLVQGWAEQFCNCSESKREMPSCAPLELWALLADALCACPCLHLCV